MEWCDALRVSPSDESIINSASHSNFTFGVQPSWRFAFDGSPISRFDFRGTEESLIDLDVILPFQFQAIEHDLQNLLHRVSLAGRNHVVVGLVLLQHQPHRLDVIAGKSPVAARVQVPERKLPLDAQLDSGSAARNLARHEIFARLGDSWLNRIPLQANRS